MTWRVAIAAAVLTLSAVFARADNNELLVTDWLQIVRQDQSSGETSVSFGRYAMIFNVGASGSHYLSDLRNVMNFYCNASGDRPSYINYFVPREVSVEGLLGAKHIPSARLRYEFADGTQLWGHFEVQENQMFIDLIGDNAPIFEKMALEIPYVLWLTENFGIEFVTVNSSEQVADWGHGDGKMSYQDFIRSQIGRSDGVTAVVPVSSRDLFTACEK